MIERVLGLADGGESAAGTVQLSAFRRFLLLYGATRSWLWLAFLGERALPSQPAVITSQPAVFAVAAVTLSVCAALAWLPNWGSRAARLALPVLLFQLWETFPQTDNHFFLELACLSLVCLADADEAASERLVLRSLRWLCLLVLFQAGLQKLLYGLYLHGDFLAFMAASDERFAALWSPLLEAAELARLRGYDVFRSGAGPFRVASWPLRLASNAVVVAELLLPILLLVPRSRVLAAWAGIALVVVIQCGAREFGFAILFVNLALLFLPGDWNRRALPLFGLLFLLALASATGVLPGWLDARSL